MPRSFERKILRSKLALLFERVWVRSWPLFVLGSVFLLVSFAGLWEALGQIAHIGLLALFGLGAAAGIVHVFRAPWPSRDEAIRRIERFSDVPHRPATSYEDTLTQAAPGSATTAIWAAHRRRMAALLDKLKVGPPQPRTDRIDPMALRALLILLVVAGSALMGREGLERAKAAFDFSGDREMLAARLDAWVTPPGYTGRAPIMLKDGAAKPEQAREFLPTEAAPGKDKGEAEAEVGEADVKAASTEPSIPDVPQKSVLVVRASGLGSATLSLDVETGAIGTKDAKVERIEAKPSEQALGVQEVRFELKETARLRVHGGSTQLAEWPVKVTPDEAPKISLSRPPELTPRGSLKLTYKAEDDFGVASAQAKLKKAPQAVLPKEKAWAQLPPPIGPRPPLMRPPTIDLRLTKPNAKESDGSTFVDFASHPWSGLKVIMTLEVKDVAGQIGRSVPFEMTLPERKFQKPLARAVVEQRRKLIDDPRYQGQVVKALAALTLEPDGFITDLKVYLGLRSVYHRLSQERSREALKSSIEQLWQIALRIEDGGLSDAEKRLKDAQDKLAKALEDGASDEDLRKLMQELKDALGDYMKQLAEQGKQNDDQQGQDQNQQQIGQEDLDRMMKNLEDMAESGSREQAQQLLNEMQDLMERMQAGKQDPEGQQRSKEMMQAMEELGDMVGDQKQLQEETFDEQRGEEEGAGEPGQQGAGKKQRPPPGMKGMGGDGRQGKNGAPPGKSDKAQKGKRGQPGESGEQGQQGQQGPGDQLGEGGQQPGGQGSLSQRQKELRDRLGKLKKELREKGMPGQGKQLGDAEQAMENAEQALEQGDLEGATEQQGQALDSMRQQAQSMAQEMSKGMPQRYGQTGDSPRDPLGRPQKSQGPDLGTSVKVPEQIDVQRAREILEEIRKRVGEQKRVPQELDYLERLLKRY